MYEAEEESGIRELSREETRRPLVKEQGNFREQQQQQQQQQNGIRELSCEETRRPLVKDQDDFRKQQQQRQHRDDVIVDGQRRHYRPTAPQSSAAGFLSPGRSSQKLSHTNSNMHEAEEENGIWKLPREESRRPFVKEQGVFREQQQQQQHHDDIAVDGHPSRYRPVAPQSSAAGFLSPGRSSQNPSHKNSNRYGAEEEDEIRESSREETRRPLPPRHSQTEQRLSPTEQIRRHTRFLEPLREEIRKSLSRPPMEQRLPPQTERTSGRTHSLEPPRKETRRTLPQSPMERSPQKEQHPPPSPAERPSIHSRFLGTAAASGRRPETRSYSLEAEDKDLRAFRKRMASPRPSSTVKMTRSTSRSRFTSPPGSGNRQNIDSSIGRRSFPSRYDHEDGEHNNNVVGLDRRNTGFTPRFRGDGGASGHSLSRAHSNSDAGYGDDAVGPRMGRWRGQDPPETTPPLSRAERRF